LVPVLAESRRRARITQCKSQMSQFYKGIVIYDDDHNRYAENFPPRLTTMFHEKYVQDGRAFLCPLDPNIGREGGKPAIASNQYPETDEGPGLNSLPSDNPWCSYMYEFSGATCTWWDGWVEYYYQGVPYLPNVPGDPSIPGDIIDTNSDGSTGRVTWQETKFYQQEWGDLFLHGSGDWTGGYPRTWLPIVRCFWHQDDPDTESEARIMNLGMDGNIFDSTPQWENTALRNLDPSAVP